MDLFDLHCVESNLPLRGYAFLFLIAWDGTSWRACSLPTSGHYDRRGAIDARYLDPAAEHILRESAFSGIDDPASIETVLLLRNLAQRPALWSAAKETTS